MLGSVVPIPTFPLFLITNRGNPEAEAVKTSPTPDWSITNPAKEVLAETEAAEVVPAKGELLPVTLKLAEVEDCPPNKTSTVELLANSEPFC
jgi:hypothetical protein